MEIPILSSDFNADEYLIMTGEQTILQEAANGPGPKKGRICCYRHAFGRWMGSWVSSSSVGTRVWTWKWMRCRWRH